MLVVMLATVPNLAVAQSIDQLFQQGNAAQSALQYSQAEAIWRRVLQQEPKNVVAYSNLAMRCTPRRS